jgi:hypothetical protein
VSPRLVAKLEISAGIWYARNPGGPVVSALGLSPAATGLRNLPKLATPAAGKDACKCWCRCLPASGSRSMCPEPRSTGTPPPSVHDSRRSRFDLADAVAGSAAHRSRLSTSPPRLRPHSLARSPPRTRRGLSNSVPNEIDPLHWRSPKCGCIILTQN